MKKINQFSILGVVLASLLLTSPLIAQAGNIGWNVSVGGGHGGGWRPAAYGPGRGPGWRGHWPYGGSPYYGPYAGYYAPPVVFASPPVVTYMPPPQPMVLSAQPQPAVWYYCQESDKYFPSAQECPTGWQTEPATPPTSSAQPKRPQQ
ncbi:MAG: hypothetical protein RLZZ406_803 [Pseudomonadota bacterium]